MNEQLIINGYEERPKNCYICRHFSELKEPRQRSDRAVIFGYCFKDIGNMEKGYAVFVPEGRCEKYIMHTGGLKEESGNDG